MKRRINTVHSALFAFAGAATSAFAQPNCPPSAPSSINAEQGVTCTGVLVDWTTVSGATSYKVYRNTSSSFSSANVIGTVLGGSNSQYTDVIALPGTRYYYWVVAIRDLCLPGNGDSSPRGPAQGWRKQAPAAPVSVSASDGTVCGGVQVTWDTPTPDLGATPSSFIVFRSTVNVIAGATNLGTVSSESFFDSTAQVGTDYWYWVRAQNSCGFATSGSDAGHPNANPAPQNETCATASVVISGNSYVGSNVCAAIDGPASVCDVLLSGDVWYRFDATAAGTLKVQTCGSLNSFDTVLAVYAACSNLQNNLIACSDDACGNLLSSITIPVVAGTDYFIRVSGYSEANTVQSPLPSTGSFVLGVQFTSGGCYANCDGSAGTPVLTANDFQCFLNEFAAGHSYANCDGSAGSPTLTANDFQCFLDRFAAGCS